MAPGQRVMMLPDTDQSRGRFRSVSWHHQEGDLAPTARTCLRRGGRAGAHRRVGRGRRPAAPAGSGREPRRGRRMGDCPSGRGGRRARSRESQGYWWGPGDEIPFNKADLLPIFELRARRVNAAGWSSPRRPVGTAAALRRLLVRSRLMVAESRRQQSAAAACGRRASRACRQDARAER